MLLANKSKAGQGVADTTRCRLFFPGIGKPLSDDYFYLLRTLAHYELAQTGEPLGYRVVVVGGTNGSDHSTWLLTLKRAGYVSRVAVWVRSRRYWYYRLTREGWSKLFDYFGELDGLITTTESEARQAA